MFYLVWQMGLFLLIAFAGGLFVGWQAWGSAGRDAEVDAAAKENARLRSENENLARRLGEAEARKPVAEVKVVKPRAKSKSEAGKTGAAGLPDAANAKPESESESEPETAAEAGADDLTAIKGLGPKAAEALKAGGVTRYAQLAGWSDSDIADWDARINGRGRIQRDDWVSQARALSKS